MAVEAVNNKPAVPAAASPSTSAVKPTTAAASKAKKKKKSGLSSFFAALGCGSSAPLEDERKSKPAMQEVVHEQAASATQSGGTKPVPLVTTAKDATNTADSTDVTLTDGENNAAGVVKTDKSVDSTDEAASRTLPSSAELALGAVVGTGAVASAAAAADATHGEQVDDANAAEVVVTPAEPVHVPEDEVSFS